MTLIRYHQHPWAWHRELLGEVQRASERSTAESADWSPAVDIEEHADKFVLFADVPGVDPKSIDVTLEKGVLTLSGSRERAVAGEGVDARRTERSHGRFARRFTLPDTVDADSVSARNANGVLEVVIPKRPAVQPRKIAVVH